MIYNLYIDVVFFVNLAMNILILVIVRRLMKVKTSMLRIILGGGIGALWACMVAVYPVLPVLFQGLLTYVGIGSLMVKVALNTRGVRELIKGVLGLYLSAITLGGAMYALYQYTNTGYYVEQLIRGDGMNGLPLIILIFLVAGAYFGTKYLWINLLEVHRQNQNLFEVMLMNEDKVWETTGLLDTGNHLYEPMSRKPVHVVSREVWNKFYKEGDLTYLIPYHTIGTSDSIMSGIIIDSIKITGEQEIRMIRKPMIAVSAHPLSRDGSYEILLHEDN